MRARKCVYVRCSVSHTLQDPVDGRRIECEVDWNLHPLDEQLVLHTVAVDLSEGRQQVEEVLVQAVLQLRRYLHAHLQPHDFTVRQLSIATSLDELPR